MDRLYRVAELGAEGWGAGSVGEEANVGGASTGTGTGMRGGAAGIGWYTTWRGAWCPKLNPGAVTGSSWMSGQGLHGSNGGRCGSICLREEEEEEEKEEEEEEEQEEEEANKDEIKMHGR